jgi:ribose transport system permease protein
MSRPTVSIESDPAAPGGPAVDPPKSTLPPAAPPLVWQLRESVLRYGMVWAMIGLAIVAVIVYPPFLTFGNLNNLVGQIAPVGIAAVGATIVIIGGGIDLSITPVVAGSAVVFALMSNSMPLAVAAVVTLLIAAGCGLINGLVIHFLKINDLIATLATGSLFSGAAYLVSNSAPIVTTASGFEILGTEQWGGIWITAYLLVAFLVVGGVALARTTYGRSVYAVGGNREAARLAGLPIATLRLSTFVIGSLCACVAGMILASQTSVGQANIASTMTLDAIAIVVVGGTSLFGGEGAMWRTAIGIIIWGTISNLFNALALSTYAQLLTQGAILLAALGLDALARRGRR